VNQEEPFSYFCDHICYLLGERFRTDDMGNMSIRNAGEILPNYARHLEKSLNLYGRRCDNIKSNSNSLNGVNSLVFIIET
jgi:hypothetical protein